MPERTVTTAHRPPDGRRLALSQRDPAFVQNPYAAYARMHAEGPVFYWQDIGHWCFAGYDRVNALLRDRRFGRQILHVATRAELGLDPPADHRAAFDALEAHSLLELEPPAHTRLRTLVNRAFVSRHVERLRPRIAALAHRLIDRFEPDGEAELIDGFAQTIPVTIIAEMLGVPPADAPRLLEWSHAMVRMYLFTRTEADEHAANGASAAFAAYLRAHIADKRARPRDDLLTLLTRAEKDGERLSEAEIVSTAVLLLNAGHEATVHQIGNAVKAILDHTGRGALAAPLADPAALFAEQEAARRCVEECLRFAPPLHLFMRYALDDVEVAGVALKRGERIGLLLGAANRDPARYAAPDRFDPARAGAPHLAFGAGVHFCLGAPLARLELETALPVLFERLPGLRLAGTPRLRDAYHFHGYERLEVVWDAGTA